MASSTVLIDHHHAPFQFLLTRGSVFKSVALIVLIIAGIWWFLGRKTERSIEERILQLLRSEDTCLLVTDRLTQQVIVHVDENHLLRGRRTGFVTARVRAWGGLDMSKISRSDLRKNGAVIEIIVPKPEIFDIAVESKSMRFVTKMTGIQIAHDYLKGRNLREELMRKIEETARNEIGRNTYLPPREKLLSRLNSHLGELMAELGVTIRFR